MPQQVLQVTRKYEESGYLVAVKQDLIETRYYGLDRTQTAGPTCSGILPGALSDDPVSTILFDGGSSGAAARTTADRGPRLLLRGNGPAQDADLHFQAQSVIGVPLRAVMVKGACVGYAYADADAAYCHLTGILPADTKGSRAAQTEDCLQQLEQALAGAGMEFRDVVRTWFFLDDLLDWYGDFNRVRNAFFAARGIFDGLIPASTGIGARNHAGAAIAANVLAMRPKHAGVRIEAVPSPLQCPAPDYRSAFSRAVEIAFPSHRQLLISGTASIAADGTSLHAGDMARQIDRTLDVVEAILHSRRMDWGDVTRGILYTCADGEPSLFAETCRRRRIPRLPLMTANDVAICRPELIFEIELDAVAANSKPWSRPCVPGAKSKGPGRWCLDRLHR